ncbi:MAG: hypothetical protein QM499_11805 [Flavobacteriaceae bacterium]
MPTNQKTKRILVPILIIVLIYSVFKTINTSKKEKQLEFEYNYTIGEITDHKIFGLAESYYIYYKYNVNGIEYSKSVNNSFNYSDCERTRSCIGLKHVVFYNIDNPEDAFMDFDLTELEMNKRNIQRKNINERIKELKIE